MRTNLIIILSILLFGCQPKLQNESPEEFARSIFQTLKSGDTVRVWNELFSKPSDSLEAKTDALRKILHKNLGTESKYMDYLNRQKKLFKEFKIEAEKMKLDWEKTEFREATYSVDHSSEYDAITYKNYYVYFTNGEQEYRFKIKNSIKVKDKIKDFTLTDLLNIKEEEERLKTENYTPSGVYVSDQYNFKYKYSDLKRFTEFYINLVNHSNEDLNNIKYKIKLLKPNSWGTGTEIFSKTFEYNSKLHEGDRERIRIIVIRVKFPW